eukprot:UN00075
MFNSPSFRSGIHGGGGGSFDQSGFNVIHRHRMIHNMNNIHNINRRMGFGLMDDDIDDMSYEELNDLFPNIPRGANEQAIQRLPTDT